MGGLNKCPQRQTCSRFHVLLDPLVPMRPPTGCKQSREPVGEAKNWGSTVRNRRCGGDAHWKPAPRAFDYGIDPRPRSRKILLIGSLSCQRLNLPAAVENGYSDALYHGKLGRRPISEVRGLQSSSNFLLVVQGKLVARDFTNRRTNVS